MSDVLVAKRNQTFYVLVVMIYSLLNPSLYLVHPGPLDYMSGKESPYQPVQTSCHLQNVWKDHEITGHQCYEHLTDCNAPYTDVQTTRLRRHRLAVRQCTP
jgi:hypothetical protein